MSGRAERGVVEMVPTQRRCACGGDAPDTRDGEFYWIRETPGGPWTVGKRDSNADEEGGWYIEGWEHPVGAYEIGPHIRRPLR